MIPRPLTSLLFAAAIALPGWALAKDGPPGPDGLPTADAKHAWHFFQSEQHVDTLVFDLRDVAPAARRQFEADEWVVFQERVRDDDKGFVLTRWKQIHHPLIWLFMGKTMARCEVEMTRAGLSRTRVTFRAALASHHKLEGNPMLPAAKKAYAKAARNWYRDVTADLTSRQHEGSIVRRQDPAVRRQEPAVRRQEPAVRHPDTAVRRQDPTARRQEPTVR